MSTRKKRERRLYALFIHYVLRKDRDWEYNNSDHLILRQETFDQIKADIKYLSQVLKESKSGWRGFAFLFLDPGWADLVKLLHQKADAYRLASLVNDLAPLQIQLSQFVAGVVPIRIVTAARLIELLRLLSQNMPAKRQKDLKRFLIGGQGQLRYDSTKLIEAIIRISNIGRNIPILRFDHDVFFPQEQRSPKLVNRTRSNILRLCNRYQELSNHPSIHYFIFSGSYLDPQIAEKLSDGSLEDLTLATALNGFATRVLQLAKIPRTLPILQKESYLEETSAEMDLKQVKLFFDTLYQVGANPFRQVISGAGLCLSDSAILDLPPYSNMSDNVMWIDDHLKFALHHELRHFGLPQTESARRRADIEYPRIGRVDEAWFQQDRYAGKAGYLAEVRWHCTEYMQRLLRGCIADAWLRKDPQLKLSAKKQSNWRKVLESAPGYYARHFAKELTWDRKSRPDMEVRLKLWEMAKSRLGEIVKSWGCEAFQGTFLHLVVKGKNGASDPEFDSWRDLGFIPPICMEGLEAAVKALPNQPSEGKPKTALEELVLGLINDFLEYIEMVRFWKTFVQSTRFLMNTRLDRTDVFWPFPEEYPPLVDEDSSQQ